MDRLDTVNFTDSEFGGQGLCACNTDADDGGNYLSEFHGFASGELQGPHHAGRIRHGDSKRVVGLFSVWRTVDREWQPHLYLQRGYSRQRMFGNTNNQQQRGNFGGLCRVFRMYWHGLYAKHIFGDSHIELCPDERSPVQDWILFGPVAIHVQHNMTRIKRIILLVLLFEASTAWVMDRYRPPVPRLRREDLPYLGGANLQIFTVSPATVSFTSSDPDASATSPSATVFLSFSGSSSGKAWTLQVRTGASTLTNCPTVPLSAVSAMCTGVTPTGSGSPTGGCAASVPLSTSYQTIASGIQGSGTDTYTINLTYNFTDAWQYPGANSCSVALTYQALADF